MNPLIVNNTCPSFAFFNEVNGRGIDIGDDCKRVGGKAASKGFANMYHLPLCKFMTRSLFSTQVNKASFPLMAGVVGQRQPLQIFRSVIKFVAVDVIDRKAICKARHKCYSNKSMYKNFRSYLANFGGNNVVSAFRYPRLDFGWLPYACKNLFFPIPFPYSRGCGSWPEDAGIRVHKPLNAFFGNVFWCHVVNDTAGHR